MKKMIAREIASKNIMIVESSAQPGDLAKTLKKNPPDCLVVTENATVTGVVRERGICRLLAGKAASLAEQLEAPVHCVAGDLLLEEIMPHLAGSGRFFALVMGPEGEPAGYLAPEVLLEYGYREFIELHSIIMSIPSGVIAVNRHGSVTMVNHAAEQMLGISAQAGVGQHISRVRQDFELLKVLQSGESQLNRKAAEGDLKLVVNRNPIRYREKIIGAVEIFQDISDLEQLSSELQSVKTLNEELESIFRSSYDEIYVTDGQGITIKVSDSVIKNCGVPAEFFIGRSVEELEAEGLFIPSGAKRALETKQTATVKSVTNIGKTIMTTATPVLGSDGEVLRVICNVRDFTELSNLKKRLEETENMAQNYRLELARRDTKRAKLDGIIGVSAQIEAVKKMICKVADLDSNILITGESGAGKGVVARAIHSSGRRSAKPFIAVNCCAIPDNLIESEFFGYEPGAFTGAGREGKKGLVELADGGTLFLDEIAEMPANLQVKLLAFLQEKKFLRVGGSKEQMVDVRIIAATNKDLRELLNTGKLREDLYYRLNVIPIHIPPLRMRRDDIRPFIEYKLAKLNELFHTHKVLKPETMRILCSNNWPGNVRELENVLERMVVTSDTYEMGPESLPDYIYREGDGESARKPVVVTDICSIEAAVNEVEKQLLEKARYRFRTTTKMAEALGVNQSTIVRKMQRHCIS